jgi:hypothetical protein
MIMLLERLAQSPRGACSRLADTDRARLALPMYASVDIPPAWPRKPVVKAGSRPIIDA